MIAVQAQEFAELPRTQFKRHSAEMKEQHGLAHMSLLLAIITPPRIKKHMNLKDMVLKMLKMPKATFYMMMMVF